jgi:hypothetical protein
MLRLEIDQLTVQVIGRRFGAGHENDLAIPANLDASQRDAGLEGGFDSPGDVALAEVRGASWGGRLRRRAIGASIRFYVWSGKSRLTLLPSHGLITPFSGGY